MMATVAEETNLEDIVATLAQGRDFSRNNVILSLDNYVDEGSLNPDWIYFLARDIEDKRAVLNLALEPAHNVNPYRLYKALPASFRSETNTPRLPHSVYFVLVELLTNNPDKYKGEEGYIQLAKDVKARTGSAAHLATIWSGARQYREELGWPRIIKMPLDAYLQAKALMPITV